MNPNSKFWPYLKRLLVIFGVSLVLALIINEVSYLLQKDQYDRPPQTIQLVVQPGTAERIAAGEEVPSIPSEMVFVVGDVLEVKNDDNVPHQLGPIWVPSGATGQLVMEKIDKLAYSCSFQTSRYLGLDIRQPTTMGTRFVALALSAPTVTALIFIYSLLVYPVKPANTSIKGEQLT